MKYDIDVGGDSFFEAIGYLTLEEQATVRQAFELAKDAHRDERRKSGEPFFSHPLTVAYMLAEYYLDAATLSAALLHDVAEDTRVELDEIRALFGDEVALLVDGVTKLKEVSAGVAAEKLMSKQEIRQASIHKLLVQAIQDTRIAIIKLFDRRHNMQTIKAIPPQKQLYIAEETQMVYAPLANRLGMWEIKSELESLAFEIIDNEAYHVLTDGLDRIVDKHLVDFPAIRAQIEIHLASRLFVVDLRYSPRNPYPIYCQMNQQGNRAYQNLDKTMRLEIILFDIESCYLAMGLLHQLWVPLPHTFDDYIARPRENLYRSLHTTVVHDSGRHLKIRLRTVGMDEISRLGILTRWKHAKMDSWLDTIHAQLEDFMSSLSESIHLDQDPFRSLDHVVQDVLNDQIRLFTPLGDMHLLARGATAVDFAYRVHTDLGHQCRGARVNGKRFPLNRPLEDGQQVFIEKGVEENPMRSWLDTSLSYIHTAHAKSKISHWFRHLNQVDAINDGKTLLEEELLMLGLERYDHQTVVDIVGADSLEDLYCRLGHAELFPTELSKRLLEFIWTDTGDPHDVGNLLTTDKGNSYFITNAGGRSLSWCSRCQPHPYDDIVGLVHPNSNEATVHQDQCYEIPINQRELYIMRLGWGDKEQSLVKRVKLSIHVYDRAGMLLDIAELMQTEKISMSSIHAEVDNGVSELLLNIGVVNPVQLVRLLHRLSALVNVYQVRCQLV